MDSSANACSLAADNAFGPALAGSRCRTFDFTITFEQSFFSIAPSAVLLLVTAARIPFLVRRKRLIEANRFKWAKVGLIGVFAVVQMALVVLWTTRSPLPAKKLGLAAAALSFLASLALGALSPLEHAKSFTPSTILCAYLLLTLLFDATILRTFWIFSFDEQVRRVFAAAFTLKALILLSEAKEKRSLVYSKHDALRSPEEFAGIYGKSLYWWLNSLIGTGFRHVLTPDQLYPLTTKLQADGLDTRFWKAWDATAKLKSKPKISLVLLRELKWDLLTPVVPRLILIAFTFCQPLLLQRFLSYLQDPVERQNANIGYGLIGAYFLVYFGMAVSSAVYWQCNYQALLMVRGMLVTAIYQKTTTVGITAIDNAKAVTLMGTDAERIVRGLSDFHELWSSIVQVALAVWLLAIQVGAAAVGPAVVCLLAVGGTLWASSLTTKRQLAWISAIQGRIGTTSSTLGAMKSARISGLTAKVSALIHSLRLNEIKHARRFWFLGAFTSTVGLVPQMVSPVITFAIFMARSIQTGETLDFTRMFTSLSLIILLTSPLFNLFGAILDFVSALGCFDRIDAYLSAEVRHDTRKLLHHDPGLEKKTDANQPRNDFAILLNNVTAGWSKEADSKPSLSNINLTIPQSKLTFVIGPVAAGKSTLLKAILGELPACSGEVFVSQKEMAFCDQTPWLINATIRMNITAYSKYQPELYQQVLRACALESDLRELKDGDATKVGSKGFGLSSGQKQRISLARAAYSCKDVILLDDVFSQLDGPTQNHIFAHLLGPDGMLRKRAATVILATHAVSFLPFADEIIALSADGTVEEQGSYENLRAKQGGYVHKMYEEHKIENSPMLPSLADASNTGTRTASNDEDEKDYVPASTSKKESDTANDKSRLLGDWKVYVYYFSCLGPVLTLGFFLFQILFAFFTVFPNIWLKWWADSNVQEPNAENARYIGGYAGLQAAGLLSSGVLTWFCFNIMAQKAGLGLHVIMLNAIMRAPMSLFGIIDTGSITTKFSQDFQLVDSSLPLSMMCVVTNLFITIGQAGLVASASAWIALCFPALVLVFYVVQRYYLRTSRQMRLLDLEQKAPLYTQFTESVEGIVTLRAFGWETRCISDNHTLVDNSQKPFYLMYMLQKWLSLVLDLIITGLAVIVVGIAVAIRNNVSVGFTGVSLSQIISLTSYMKLIILFWTQMEMSLGAVNRIKTFSEEAGDENLPEETYDPPTPWPSHGAVVVKDLSVAYKTAQGSHTALHKITLNIPRGTKVGICGRTGSGKSTLILALLKLVDSEGSVTIDDVNLASIPRDSLRQKIIVVSDDVFFFPGGTLRDNLDPLSLCSDDAQLKEILQDFMLWDMSVSAAATKSEKDARKEDAGDQSSTVNPLDAPFSSVSLSHGQKQLFALARALVRQQCKGPGVGGLVILDEATSRTDKETDSIIQRVIRKRFEGCTLVMIAHRLESILDFDRIVVLEQGRVVEYDAPGVLRGKEGGVFRAMMGTEGV
ncbi:hypothetical protein CC86DRAFT_451542 [Ophiobolus disseminans]|uniref:P-loop containing nucleoside triphosphate hydrolase protein n=1 Tax=Ophiobolus disseminans TaxID=1469910 RepID=A0A6A7AL92_9PLEO|nr:hypothetical protein CC86DRAFT_451542 [Ophiobolus disseminans]